MAVDVRPALASPADRLLRLAVDPATIAAFAAVGSVALVAAQVRQVTPWVALVAVVAGWSSAWSP